MIFRMTRPPNIAIIVLAAGASTRFGAPKQLLLYKGVSLLHRTVDTALLSRAKSVYVVLGYEAKKVKLEIAVNDEYVQPTIDAIIGAARSGNIGDGKIFVLDLKDCIRIRTGETGHMAIG